jgi:hypothetical protein
VAQNETPPTGQRAGLRDAVQTERLNFSGNTPALADFQAQKKTLADWAGKLAAKSRRLLLCRDLGLLTWEEHDALFDEVEDEVEVYREAIIRLAAMRRAER